MLELIDHKDVIRDLKFAPNGSMSLGKYLQIDVSILMLKHKDLSSIL